MADIDDVEPIGAGDADCLKELYAVLKRHDKHERFGLTLLHKHFPMQDNEVLLEHTDAATRRLVLQPAHVDSPEIARSIQTSWMLTDGQTATVNTACYRSCMRNIQGNHDMGPHRWS